VYLSIGSNTSRMVASGDTLRTLPQSDLETMSSDVAIASRQFPEIISNIKLLNQELKSARGTLGAFGIEHGDVQLVRAQNEASRFLSRAKRPTGTIGLALASSSSLADRARRVMSRADSVRALLASVKSSLGRFRKDSTLLREVVDIRNELDVVRARLTSPTGTLGRARTDSALFAAVSGAQREMTLIMADIHRRPLRYIHF
jgi:hypothetical protein